MSKIFPFKAPTLYEDPAWQIALGDHLFGEGEGLRSYDEFLRQRDEWTRQYVDLYGATAGNVFQFQRSRPRIRFVSQGDVSPPVEER